MQCVQAFVISICHLYFLCYLRLAEVTSVKCVITPRGAHFNIYSPFGPPFSTAHPLITVWGLPTLCLSRLSSHGLSKSKLFYPAGGCISFINYPRSHIPVLLATQNDGSIQPCPSPTISRRVGVSACCRYSSSLRERYFSRENTAPAATPGRFTFYIL